MNGLDPLSAPLTPLGLMLLVIVIAVVAICYLLIVE